MKFTTLAIIGALALGGGTATAQEWQPSGNVEIIVGTDPGSTNDRVARILQKVITEGQLAPVTMSVVNKPGAAQAAAIAYMNNHGDDTNFLTVVSASWLNTAVINNTTASLAEATPIHNLFQSSSSYFVNPDSPIKTAQDIIDRLKADVGSVTFAASGAPGSQNHLTMIKFAQAAGVDPSQIRLGLSAGGGEVATQVAGGHADIGVAGVDTALPLVQGGQLRFLAVLKRERLDDPAMAEVPTFVEQGVDAVSENWFGIVGPKNMPAEQVAYWDGVIDKAMQSDEVKQFAAENFWSIENVAAADYKQFLDDQTVEQTEVLGSLGLVAK